MTKITTDDLAVIKQVMTLQNMDSDELTSLWSKFFDFPPEISSKEYMMGRLAYKIQEMAYGDTDPGTEEKIKECMKKVQRPLDKKTRKFMPMIGTQIKKEYRGELHEVLVVPEGFSYKNEVFKSLSAIAAKITGTKWNGPKFFGVKG